MIDKDAMAFIGCMMLAVILLFCGLLGIGTGINYYSCQNHGDMYETESEFRIFGGCYLERGDRMIRLDDYKYVELRADQ